MISNRQLFFQHLAPTSTAPLALEIAHAKGVWMHTPEGERILDLISGISVSNVGHCHPAVVKAVEEQSKKFMHLMVYGELIQAPQVLLAQKITSLLPEPLNSVFLVNSGSEANEGAMKLAKRITGRFEIASFNKAYHGSTHGCLSIIGDESFKRPFRPLPPGNVQLTFNDEASLSLITEKTAAVFVELVQGEAGVIKGEEKFVAGLRKKCDETGTLMIVDEVQTGFGRTGKMFAFEHYGILPDIITFAKGMGGGMPIGAFVASNEMMRSFTNNPVLGNITTFGGHPVSAAAALASMNVILHERLYETVNHKEQLFLQYLSTNKKIVSIRSAGLMMAVQLNSYNTVQRFIDLALQHGILTDWFLFCDSAIRIAPPLIITNEEIEYACSIINETLDLV